MNLTKVNCEKTLYTRRLLYIVVEEEHSYYARAVGKGGRGGGHLTPPPLCVEMGLYADIFWESRCNIEINVCDHFYKILLVFGVPYRPRVKWIPGKG